MIGIAWEFVERGGGNFSRSQPRYRHSRLRLGTWVAFKTGIPNLFAMTFRSSTCSPTPRPVLQRHFQEASRAEQMRKSKLSQSFSQAQSGEALPGRNRTSGEVKHAEGTTEGADLSPDRILLALRPMRVRDDSVVRKGSRRGRGSAARFCEEEASSCGARGNNAQRGK